MTTKHTPVPWAIEPDHDDIDGTVLIHGAADCPGLTPVALVYTADAFPCVEDEDRAAFETECRANAALIAAAPGLMGVCESLVEWYEGLVKEYESAAAERTEWVGMSEFEALLQDEDDDLVVNDPVLTAIIDLARTHIAKAHGNADQTEASQ